MQIKLYQKFMKKANTKVIESCGTFLELITTSSLARVCYDKNEECDLIVG